MRKYTKRYLHKVQLYLSQQPYQKYSHCLFNALPPRFADDLYLSLIFSTGVDSPCGPCSPTCWHPSVHWITQPVVKHRIQEKMDYQIKSQGTPEHMTAFATGIPHAQPTQFLRRPHQKCKVPADAKMWGAPAKPVAPKLIYLAFCLREAVLINNFLK